MDEISLSNLALKHLVEELQVLANGFVNNVQVLENHWIKMKVHTKQGGKDLILAPNALFISEYSIPARMQPSGYPSLLKKHLFNQRILSIKQHGVDRIVLFEFPKNVLILELFARGNIVLCDREMEVIKARWREEWKDRKLEKGETYKAPTSKGANPLEENAENFYANLQANRKTFFGATVDLLNVAPQIIEQIFERNKLDKKKNASDVELEEAEKILEVAKSIYSGKEGAVFPSNGIIYSADVGLKKEAEFGSVNSALNELLVKKVFEPERKKGRAKEESGERVSPMRASTEAKKREIERLIEEEKNLKAKAEKIYLNYKKMSEIIRAVESGKAKGLTAKEIMNKINSVDPVVEELDLTKGKLKIKIN